MSKHDIKFNLIRHFGPSIFHAKIPVQIIEILNNYMDEIIKDNEKQKKYDHGNNLVGDVTEELTLDRELIEKSGWLNFLSKCTHKWIELTTGKKIKKFNLIETWIVRQFKNEYNPTHWHGGHISGAGFLKVPKNLGEYKQKKIKIIMLAGICNLFMDLGCFYVIQNSQLNPRLGTSFFFLII